MRHQNTQENYNMKEEYQMKRVKNTQTPWPLLAILALFMMNISAQDQVVALSNGPKWSLPYDSALAEAKAGNKPLLVFMGAKKNCEDCETFIKTICADPKFIAYAKENLICTKVLEDDNDPYEERVKAGQIMQKYNIPHAHAVVIANAQGVRIGELSTVPISMSQFVEDIKTIVEKAPADGRLKYLEVELFDKNYTPKKSYATQPVPTFSKEPLKGRYINFMCGIRLFPYEVTRSRRHGSWMERAQHTPAAALKMRTALAEAFPGARMTWTWSLGALKDQAPNYVGLRELMVQFNKQYGDEITFWSGGFFGSKFNTIEQCKKDIHDGLEFISKMIGDGYRPKSVIAGIMSVDVMRFLAENEGIHVVQGQIWSQFNVDGQGGDGGIIYPYYPSKDHYLKPAQGTRKDNDFVDIVNIDGWSIDFFAARNNGGGSRDGNGPLETHGGYGLGGDYGLREMMHVTDTHFNEEAIKRNSFGFLPTIYELLVFSFVDPTYLPKWVSAVRAKYPDTQMLTLGEYGELWRKHNPDNSRINLKFVQRGNGNMPSPEEGKKINPGYQFRADLFCPDKEIRWYFNKDFRFATIFNWQGNGTTLVMDYTRYNQPYKEPSGNVIAQQWDLLDIINQKQSRPQDKYIPFKELPPEEQVKILKWYPEVAKEP
jgi:thioredoxin-related protein